MRRITILVVGWILTFAGLAGLVLPILPGIALLLAGLALLSSEYRWARTVLGRIKERWRPATAGDQSCRKSAAGIQIEAGRPPQ